MLRFIHIQEHLQHVQQPHSISSTEQCSLNALDFPLHCAVCTAGLDAEIYVDSTLYGVFPNTANFGQYYSACSVG